MASLPYKGLREIKIFLCTLFYITEGCKAYGYACYGGHGKRTVFDAVEMEQSFISSPDAVLMLYSNTPNLLHANNRQVGEQETPPLQLIKILKPWVRSKQQQCSQRVKFNHKILNFKKFKQNARVIKKSNSNFCFHDACV